MDFIIREVQKLERQDLFAKEKDADKCAEVLFSTDNEERYYYLCRVFKFCSKSIKADIEEELYKNWSRLDAYALRLVVEESVFKYDDFIREAFVNRITEWNEKGEIDRVVITNPLICMVDLYLYSILKKSDLIYIERYADKSKMLSFITHTESFNIDEFDMEWSFIFKRREYKEIYLKMKQDKIDNIEREERIARRKKYFG